MGLKVILDELAKTLIREGAILLDEPAIENKELSDPGEVLELLEQAGLADSRFPRHGRELAFTRDCRVQPALQLRELLLTPDERGQHGPLDHAASAQNDGLPELVGCKTRLVAPERFGNLSRFL